MSERVTLMMMDVVSVIARRVGNLGYIAAGKLYGWVGDLSDEAGLTRGRRSFLDVQIDLEKAQNLEVLWEHICRALEMMQFDRGELHLNGIKEDHASDPSSSLENGALLACTYEGADRREPGPLTDPPSTAIWAHKAINGHSTLLVWARGCHRRQEDTQDKGLLHMEIPFGVGNPPSARLVLIKDLSYDPVQPFTLRRVEYLRRSLGVAISNLFPSPSP
jgi:UDP-GlcNAc:undecaprenyl-phosphate GlcNAc-1-phosphate transferase